MEIERLEKMLPTMTKDQLIETVKTCLRLIERMNSELGEGARKMDEMTALLHKVSQDNARTTGNT